MLGLVNFCVAFRLLYFDSALVLEVGFVPNDHDCYVFFIGVIPKLLHPFLHLVKRLGGSDVVDYDGPDSIPIVNGRNRIVLFLSCCILKLVILYPDC